jgi:hypothetical protein
VAAPKPWVVWAPVPQNSAKRARAPRSRRTEEETYLTRHKTAVPVKPTRAGDQAEAKLAAGGEHAVRNPGGQPCGADQPAVRSWMQRPHGERLVLPQVAVRLGTSEYGASQAVELACRGLDRTVRPQAQFHGGRHGLPMPGGRT